MSKIGWKTEIFFLIFFFVFLTHADSECTFANWQHYQCCSHLKREETLILLQFPKFRFFFAFLHKILLVQPYARSYFGSSKPSILRLLLDNFTRALVSCKFLGIFRIVFWKCHIPLDFFPTIDHARIISSRLSSQPQNQIC